jgi:hypothetical protein
VAALHAGEFQKAVEAGLKAHGAGIAGGMTVANKAQAIYATYLEGSERNKLALLLEVAERAERRAGEAPKEANAWYCMAYALGRYSQGISIAKALAQGLGARVKIALETTIQLAPKHADAHIALGAYHAEIIDKVGSLLGRTQGASKDAGLAHYKTALKLNPTSAIAMVEYANGLVMLEGREADEGSDKAVRGRRRVRAARRDGAARRRDGQGRARRLGCPRADPRECGGARRRAAHAACPHGACPVVLRHGARSASRFARRRCSRRTIRSKRARPPSPRAPTRCPPPSRRSCAARGCRRRASRSTSVRSTARRRSSRGTPSGRSCSRRRPRS